MARRMSHIEFMIYLILDGGLIFRFFIKSATRVPRVDPVDLSYWSQLGLTCVDGLSPGIQISFSFFFYFHFCPVNEA